MARTQIDLTQEQVTALEKLAKQRNLSLSDLLQEGIRSLLQTSEPKYTPEQKQRALAIIGRYRSGQADLSTNHDAYFLEALNS